jgi:hypothetical protein
MKQKDRQMMYLMFSTIVQGLALMLILGMTSRDSKDFQDLLDDWKKNVDTTEKQLMKWSNTDYNQ